MKMKLLKYLVLVIMMMLLFGCGTTGPQGEQGIQGIPGKDGHTPVVTIGENGNWYIDGVDSGIRAEAIKGEDGIGVISIEKTATNGLIDTYTITFTNSETTTFTVTNGKDGATGAQGIQGIQGEPGKDGHTPVITIENGNWYIDGVNTNVLAEGLKGETGNGISSIKLTNTEDLIDTYTITFTNGQTTTFTVTNGKDGAQGIQGIQGIPGKDGHTPVITIENGNWHIDGVDSGVSAIIQTEALYINVSSYGINPGKVNVTLLNELLKEDVKNRVIVFPDGEYVFSDTIVMQSNWRIEGQNNTIFKLDVNSNSDILLKLYEVDNVRINNIKFAGTNDKRPSEKGNINGIVVEKCRSVNLDDLDIYGWTKCGVYSKTMSSFGSGDGAFYKQLQINNCRFYNNYYGTYYDYRCEYTQTINCVFGENYIGSLNAGGNNIYTGCIWNVNYIGFYLENNGSNPAHGGCNGCTFNHNISHAIYVEDCINGWLFNSCQVFYGKVELINSKGVIFDSNVWGSCYLYSTFTNTKNVNIISDTYFLTDVNVILNNNDGSVKITNCIPEYVKKETVIFDYNDGVNKIVEEVESGEKVNKPANPVRDGYEFSGWFVDKELTTEYDFNSSVNSSFTLYCKWTANSNTDCDLNWDVLVNTNSNKDYLSLSTNAYSGASMFPLEKNAKVDYIDFVINKGNAETSISGVNLWAINSETGSVIEKIIDNEEFQCVYSDVMKCFVIRININKVFDYSVYFVIQSIRNNDGSGIAYYKDDIQKGYLRGDKDLVIGETLETNSNVVPVYVLYREKMTNVSITFIGDSITYGVGTDKTYWKMLDESKEFGNVRGYGVSGSCISSKSDYGNNNSPLINRYMNLPYSNIYVIFMGTNDYGHETPLGNIDDNSDTSFYGALNVIVSGIKNKYDDSEIVFVTPLHRYGAGTSKILNQKYTYDYLNNGVEASLGDYRKAIIDICNKYNLQYIDLYNETGFTPENAEFRKEYMPDGIHPNQKGHEIISQIIKKYLYMIDVEKSIVIDKITMKYGNKFASMFNDNTRASSTLNIYIEAGSTVRLLNPNKMKWAIGETKDEVSDNKISGYYPEAQWSSIDSYTITKSGYYGFTFKYENEEVFDFEATPDSDDLMKYIVIE